MNPSVRFKLFMLIGVVAYVVLAIVAILDPAQRPAFINFNWTMALGTIGLALRDMPPPPPPPAVVVQSVIAPTAPAVAQ